MYQPMDAQFPPPYAFFIVTAISAISDYVIAGVAPLKSCVFVPAPWEFSAMFMLAAMIFNAHFYQMSRIYASTLFALMVQHADWFSAIYERKGYAMRPFVLSLYWESWVSGFSYGCGPQPAISTFVNALPEVFFKAKSIILDSHCLTASSSRILVRSRLALLALGGSVYFSRKPVGDLSIP